MSLGTYLERSQLGDGHPFRALYLEPGLGEDRLPSCLEALTLTNKITNYPLCCQIFLIIHIAGIFAATTPPNPPSPRPWIE